MVELTENTVLFRPRMSRFSRQGITFLIDAEAPNWISTDSRGAGILDQIDGKQTFRGIVQEYAETQSMDSARAWLHVHGFIREALRHRMVSVDPIPVSRYTGLSSQRALRVWAVASPISSGAYPANAAEGYRCPSE